MLMKFDLRGSLFHLACHDIDQWALPMPGEMLSLPILGNLIEVNELKGRN